VADDDSDFDSDDATIDRTAKTTETPSTDVVVVSNGDLRVELRADGQHTYIVDGLATDRESFIACALVELIDRLSKHPEKTQQ